MAGRWSGRRARVVLWVIAMAGFVVATPSPAAAAGFNNGDAQATADAFSLNLKAANATIGFTYGRSIAEYRDRTASAEARALDLGALPTLFGGEQCDGSPPLLNPATLPPLTRADSAVPGSERSRRTQVFQPGVSGGPAGDPAGFQDATATPLPSSVATTESVPLDIFLIGLDGARTEVRTRLENRVREAHAVVTAERLRVFGGLFTFTRPRWEALTRSGAQNVTQAGFSFESATVLGIPRSAGDALADLDGFKRGLEELLAPLGVRLELPRVETTEDGVRVTPMGFRVVNPPFGRDVLVPFLGRIDPLVQALRAEAVRADCKNELVLTVVDVLLGVMGGSGAIEALAGGVEVATRDVDYTVTAPDELPPPPEQTPTSVDEFATSESSGSLDTWTAFDADLPFAEVGSDLAVGDLTAVATAPAATTPPRRRSEALPASTTRFEDGPGGAVAVAVGTAALVGALALSLGDRLVANRRRRTIP